MTDGWIGEQAGLGVWEQPAALGPLPRPYVKIHGAREYLNRSRIWSSSLSPKVSVLVFVGAGRGKWSEPGNAPFMMKDGVLVE